MKNLYLLVTLIFTTSTTLFSQIRTNNGTSGNIGGQSAFIDASANLFSDSDNSGKGIAFPTTDLTVFTFNPSSGSSSSYPTAFHGFVVFNTETGTTPGSGSGVGNQSVEPGFYYFNNPTPGFGFPTTAGTWTPVGNGGTPAIHVVDDTPAETGVIINGNAEKVIRLSGTADGMSTHIDLGTTVLAANTVSVFRKAVIYDATTGHIISESTGSYDTAINKFVTGNGMMNYLLSSGTYDVEVYYTE